MTFLELLDLSIKNWHLAVAIALIVGWAAVVPTVEPPHRWGDRG